MYSPVDVLASVFHQPGPDQDQRGHASELDVVLSGRDPAVANLPFPEYTPLSGGLLYRLARLHQTYWDSTAGRGITALDLVIRELYQSAPEFVQL